jgi:hypothetical protein
VTQRLLKHAPAFVVENGGERRHGGEHGDDT